MATVIRTIKDGEDLVLPRTKARAVTTENGKSVEELLAATGDMLASTYDPQGKGEDVYGYTDAAIAGLPVKKLVGTEGNPVDVDTLTEPGFYYITGNSTNSPYGNQANFAFWLTVSGSTFDSLHTTIYQQIEDVSAVLSGNASTSGERLLFGYRKYENGIFSDWRSAPVQSLDKNNKFPSNCIPDLSRLYLSTAGGTLTGPLTLPAAPTEEMQAANKGYVDAAKQAAMDASRPADWTPTAEGVGALPIQTGAVGQLLGFTAANTVGAVDKPAGKRTCRFVVGTSTAGWTENDCDYLCDGTNDQVVINAAIQALPEGGGEVVILDGTYNIKATIALNRDYVRLSGKGKSTVLKRMWDSTESNPGIITVSAVNGGCSISDLYVDGNKSLYVSFNNCGICLEASSGNILTRNTCADNRNIGITLRSSNKNILDMNTCSGSNIGVKLVSSSENTITYNYSSISLTSSSNNVVTGNFFSRTSSEGIDGIELKSSSNNNITENMCKIYLTSSTGNLISGNQCNETGSSGIRLESSSDNNTVTGNTCNNNFTGISLLSSSSNILTGNTAMRGTGLPSDYGANQYTIYLSGESNDNLIACNKITGKNIVIYNGSGSGTGNIIFGNKWANTSDIPTNPQNRTVTLPAASWDAATKKQTVTVTGVTANNAVTPSPSPASWESAGQAGVRCTAQAANSLTFTCTTVPTVHLTYNVLIQEVQ